MAGKIGRFLFSDDPLTRFAAKILTWVGTIGLSISAAGTAYYVLEESVGHEQALVLAACLFVVLGQSLWVAYIEFWLRHQVKVLGSMEAHRGNELGNAGAGDGNRWPLKYPFKFRGDEFLVDLIEVPGSSATIPATPSCVEPAGPLCRECGKLTRPYEQTEAGVVYACTRDDGHPRFVVEVGRHQALMKLVKDAVWEDFRHGVLSMDDIRL